MKIIPAYPKTNTPFFRIVGDTVRHHMSDYAVGSASITTRIVKRGIMHTITHHAAAVSTEKQTPTLSDFASVVRSVRSCQRIVHMIGLPSVSVMHVDKQRQVEDITPKTATYTAGRDTAATDNDKKAIADLRKATSTAYTAMKKADSAKRAAVQRLLSESLRCTTKREKRDFEKAFFPAFRSAVIEDMRNTRKDRRIIKSEIIAVHTKIDALKKKIAAAQSIIAQYRKKDASKINVDLIYRKCDMIGLSVIPQNADESAALLASLSSRLHKAVERADKLAVYIDTEKSRIKSYYKILHSDEILITVMTDEPANTTAYTVKAGYLCTEKNSTSAVMHIRQIVQNALEKMGMKNCYIDVVYNTFGNGDTLLPLAKQLVKRQAFNMIQRQGSKTQYAIYYACMRNDFTDHDTADLYSVCYSTILTALSVKNPATVTANIRILEKLNSLIQHLNLVIDCDQIEKITAAANRAVKKYHCIIPAAADYNKNKRMITMLKNIYAAAVNHNIPALKTACYNAMNDYLIGIRAIHDADKITLNIDDYIDRLITTIDTDDAAAVKKHALQIAYTETKKHLTRSTLATFDYMLRGYTPAQIAEKRKIDKSTISKHINEIRAAFCTAYTALIDSEKIDNSANIVLFDPSIFAAVKKVSEKQKKVIDTYSKNTELEKITAAVNSDSIAAACMKYEFKKSIKGLKMYELQVVTELLNDKSIRKAAAAADISKSAALRVKAKITDTFYSIIELNTDISIDRNSLVKVNFYQLVSILID